MSTPDMPAQPTYSLVINGVDLTNRLEDATWTITQNWSRQGDTATFNLYDENTTGPIGLGFYITPLAKIVLTDTSLGQVIFSGLISFPEVYYQGPNLQMWTLQCVDWTYMADRGVVFGDFITQSADQIIKSLAVQANCGVTTNHVQAGPMITRLQIIYMPLSKAIAKVCQYASGVSTYGWYVDENQDLHFYDETQAGMPVAVFSDLPADFQSGTYVPNYTGNYDRDFYYGWDATSIRNAVYVRGGVYESQYIDAWLGDGTQQSWPLTYTPDPQNLNPELVIGGVFKTISVQTGTSATTQWAIVQDAAGGWSLTNVSDTIPAAGALITFEYNYIQPVTALVRDAGSIAQFSSLPNGGVFSSYIADTSLQSLTSASQRGRRETASYALPEERVTFNSSPTFTGHVRAGQIITWKNQFIRDSQNGNLPGINDTFMVVQNMISGKFSGYRSYQITAARVSTGGGP